MAMDSTRTGADITCCIKGTKVIAIQFYQAVFLAIYFSVYHAVKRLKFRCFSPPVWRRADLTFICTTCVLSLVKSDTCITRKVQRVRWHSCLCVTCLSLWFNRRKLQFQESPTPHTVLVCFPLPTFISLSGPPGSCLLWNARSTFFWSKWIKGAVVKIRHMSRSAHFAGSAKVSAEESICTCNPLFMPNQGTGSWWKHQDQNQ